MVTTIREGELSEARLVAPHEPARRPFNAGQATHYTSNRAGVADARDITTILTYVHALLFSDS